MPKYIRKPEKPVTAIQWKRGNFEEVADTLAPGTTGRGLMNTPGGMLTVVVEPSNPSSTIQHAHPGDYIILQPSGCRQVVGADYFERNFMLYEEPQDED